MTADRLLQLEGVVTAWRDGTPATSFDVAAAKADDRIDIIPKDQVHTQWAFVGAVVAKAGPAGYGIRRRFERAGGSFPNQ